MWLLASTVTFRCQCPSPLLGQFVSSGNANGCHDNHIGLCILLLLLLFGFALRACSTHSSRSVPCPSSFVRRFGLAPHHDSRQSSSWLQVRSTTKVVSASFTRSRCIVPLVSWVQLPVHVRSPSDTVCDVLLSAECSCTKVGPVPHLAGFLIFGGIRISAGS